MFFLEIWAKNNFVKVKKSFSRNIDIYGFINKKQFFQNKFKKWDFPRNVDTYGDVDKKYRFIDFFFVEIWANNYC